ncbi:2-hydroxy-3-oxopropionate reductase [Mesorhizobium sp. ZC-5]|uniref:2-hydroxy-3-oxopropionate reductase n=1 Tax=Mesorhizobium sp. ZC-5 TaxID=2986066 RepID=UPI0021E70E99|nr:2-hydroxy-3-oxopropionate reductase [Mesorhizobium sp. ZC-5]MCV3242862.1 2-hydroxy-3-oxopropionate reductase [Mesorhizobium sp. ZC-5]
MKIGFIGLGIMGRPIAGHIVDGGHQMAIYSRSSPPSDLLEKGAVVCASSREVAERADVIIVMVPDTPDVEAVLFSRGGVADGLTDGKTVIDMSSISPIATKEFAARIAEKGCDYLDAPVSGGEVGAKAATLSIMVGGTQETFDRVKPLFDLVGKNITLVGSVGDGQTAKVANQIIVAVTIEAVGEALLFASKAGADPARVRAALMGGFASSRILEVHGERMIKRSFDPGFKVELHQKDLNLALEGARQLRLALPNTATCQQLFSVCAAHGGSLRDHSAMVNALEIMADHEIASAT